MEESFGQLEVVVSAGKKPQNKLRFYQLGKRYKTKEFSSFSLGELASRS
jgi:hypothetical protein